MKRILYSICVGIVVVAFTALGQPDRTAAKGKDRQSRKANVKAVQSSKPGAGAMKRQGVRARGDTRGQRKLVRGQTRTESACQAYR